MKIELNVKKFAGGGIYERYLYTVEDRLYFIDFFDFDFISVKELLPPGTTRQDVKNDFGVDLLTYENLKQASENLVTRYRIEQELGNQTVEETKKRRL